MIENKEVKIAIIVGTIMITICLLVFIITSSSNKQAKNIDLKIYKLYDIEGTANEHEYRPCKITTDDLIAIKDEYLKIEELTDKNRITGKQITGNYKIILGGEYIAFDANENNYVYRSNVGTLYEYDSMLYEYVKKICN